MVKINSLTISPPLINTACAWASDYNHLEALFNCPYTGAVTTRTATLKGYKETDAHTVAFTTSSVSSVNSYGYSPHPLSHYLSWIETILTSPTCLYPSKPFIISVAATTWSELDSLIDAIQTLRSKLSDRTPGTSARIAIELNTSCPNVGPTAPPTGYDFDELRELLNGLETAHRKDRTLTIGLKLPPYTYHKQFVHVLNVLSDFSIGIMSALGTPMKKRTPFAFITCTNTLGNSLLFSDQTAQDESTDGRDFALPTPLGGLAGEALHSLALGNVYSFHKLLHLERPKEYDGLETIVIIGVGGVTSKQAAARMTKAGAGVIGAATLLGKEGVKAFEMLSESTE